MQEKILILIRIISGLVGAILLYREVKISHSVDEYRSFLQSKRWLWLKEMHDIYQKDLREFYKRFTIDGLKNSINLSEETIENQKKFIDKMSEEELKENIARQKISGENLDLFMANLPSKFERHNELSSEGGMKQRKFLLNLGIVLIAMSATVDIILTFIKNS